MSSVFEKFSSVQFSKSICIAQLMLITSLKYRQIINIIQSSDFAVSQVVSYIKRLLLSPRHKQGMFHLPTLPQRRHHKQCELSINQSINQSTNQSKILLFIKKHTRQADIKKIKTVLYNNCVMHMWVEKLRTKGNPQLLIGSTY